MSRANPFDWVNLRIKSIFIYFLSFVITLSGMPNSYSAAKEITLAYQGPLTGEEAQIGIDQYAGVKFAVNQFTKKFGNQFRISIKQIDDQGDPNVAAKVSESASNDKSILGIVGPAYSGATIASLTSYKRANIPLISPSAVRISLTDPAQGAIGFPIFHRISSTDRLQGPALYRTAIRGVASPSVFVVDDQSPYGVGLFQHMKQGQGVSIGGSDSVSGNTTDWSSTITKIKSANANVVIFLGYYAQAATLFRQLRDFGFKGVLAGGDGVLSPGILSLASASVLEGVRMTGGAIPLSEVSTQTEQLFKKEIGMASGTYAVEAIDATNIFLYCIVKGITTRENMQKCINDFKGKSITGDSLSFDSYGDRAIAKFYEFKILSGNITVQSQSQLTIQQVLENSNWYGVKSDSSQNANNVSTKPTSQAVLETIAAPLAPKNFKTRRSGNIILVTVDSTVKAGANASEGLLFSPSLGISKGRALRSTIIGGKAIFEIPYRSDMAGKSFAISVIFVNEVGESVPLESSLTVPQTSNKPAISKVSPKPAIPKTVICKFGNQTRSFAGDCPPGWVKS